MDLKRTLECEVSDAQTTGVCSVFVPRTRTLQALVPRMAFTPMSTPGGSRSVAVFFGFELVRARVEELKKCQERGEALASLLSLVRAHAFQPGAQADSEAARGSAPRFPFRITVRKKEVDEIGPPGTRRRLFQGLQVLSAEGQPPGCGGAGLPASHH